MPTTSALGRSRLSEAERVLLPAARSRWRLVSGIWLIFLADAFVPRRRTRDQPLAALRCSRSAARWPSASAYVVPPSRC